jgi:glycosyltransferase involved in cell wall biosynthesis
MKLLVFAHTPPPHHGQSYMVQLMLAGFGGDRRRNGTTPEKAGSTFGIDCYHVNARLSQKLEDIGDLRIGKFLLLLGYCLQAIWCRFRYGVTTLYYIPAPGKRSALYRDWLVMFLCRRFFKHVILHWHAAGLAKWLETVLQIRSRALTYRLMKQVDLSIVLSRYNRADAEKIFSRRIKIVGNGIPDPCARFAEEVLPRRKARFAARQKLLAGKPLGAEDLRDSGEEVQTVQVLYLAHCTREKGLFDAVNALLIANQRLAARQSPIALRLLVAGTFVNELEKAQFEEAVAQFDATGAIRYLGFVSGDQKNNLLREADVFCFPTYYANENQPVNLIEAMAYGVPILTTRWRSIPELFPANYAGLVEVRSPEQLAEAMLSLISSETGEGFRSIFLREFTLERHLAGLAQAFQEVEQEPAGAKLTPYSQHKVV